jgi:hypothetical protein
MATTNEILAGADISRQLGDYDKLATLEQNKQQKLERLGGKQQFADLSRGTFTELGNGLVESNANKIWNDMNSADIQNVLGTEVSNAVTRRDDGSLFQRDAEGNEVDYQGDSNDLRRFYMYGAKGSDAVKAGLARGDLPSSDYRYQPGRAEAEGFNVGRRGYGWEPGADGVDLEKKYLDILLPKDRATALEASIHGRKGALDGRQFQDVLSNKALGHASGTSEYYNNLVGMLGDSRTSEATGAVLGDFVNREVEPSQFLADVNASVMSAETGKAEGDYAVVGDIGDGAGLSFGAHQLTEKSGGIAKFLAKMTKSGDTRAASAAKGTKGELAQYLVEVGNTPAGKQAQEAIYNDDYALPALELAKEHGITDSAAIAQMIDHSVNAGLGGAARMLEKAEGNDAQAIAAARKEDYSGLNNFDKYGGSWFNRVDETTQRMAKYDGVALGAGGKQSFEDVYSDVAAENANPIVQTAKAFGTSFVKELAVDTLDWIGEATNTHDLGDESVKTEMVNKWFDYSPRNIEEAQKKVSVLNNKIWDKDTSWEDKIKFIAEATWTAFKEPEMLGQSMGVLGAWIVPGAILTKGDKAVKAYRAVDAALSAGGMTRRAALLQKAKILGSKQGLTTAVKGQSGQVSAAIGNINDQYEEFVANNDGIVLGGADKAEWFVTRFGVQMLNQNLDAITDLSILRAPGLFNAAKKSIGALSEKKFVKLATSIGSTMGSLAFKQMPKEASQEYTQRMMELFNERYGSEKFSDQDTFVKFISDKGNMQEGTLDALMGAGGAGQFQVVGGARTNLAKATGFGADKLSAEIERRKKAKVTEVEKPVELSKEEKATLGATLSEVKSSVDDGTAFDKPEEYVSKLNSIADMVGRLDETSVGQKVAKEDFKRFVGELSKAVDEMDENEPIVFGSKESPDKGKAEDAIGYILDGTADLSEEKNRKLLKIAKANGISEERYNRIKTAASVEEEVSGGKRGYLSYNRQIKSILESGNPDKKKLTKVVNDAQRLHDSQVKFLNELEIAVDEAQRRADVGNASGMLTDGRKVKVDIPKSNWSVVVNGKEKGKYVVDAQSVALLDSKKRNIAGSKIGLQLVTDSAVTEGGLTAMDVGKAEKFELPVAAGKTGVASEIKKDTTRFDKRGVTKAILPKDTQNWTPKWGIYKSKGFNGQLINSGEYTAKDTVVVGAKEWDKGMKAEMAKAMKAGATVIIDSNLEEEARAGIEKQLIKFGVGKDASYVKYNKVKVEDGFVYVTEKAAKKVKVATEKIKASKEVKAKAIDGMVLAVAEDMLNGVSEKDTKKMLKKKYGDTLKTYFVATESKSSVDKAYEAATRRVSKQVSSIVNFGIREDIDSVNLINEVGENAELKGITSKVILELAVVEYDKLVAKLNESEDVLSLWKDVAESTGINEIIDENTISLEVALQEVDKNAIQGYLDSSISKGKVTAYQYMKGKRRVTKFAEKGIDKDAVDVRARELDVNEIIELASSGEIDYKTDSPLAILPSKFLGRKVKLHLEEAVALVKSAIPVNDYGEAKNKNLYMLADSPARGLLLSLDENGNEVVNDNVALALRLVAGELFKTNGFMMSSKRKSNKDLAVMLGLEEFQITDEISEAISDKGMLLKSAVGSAGSSMAKLLGIKRKKGSEVDEQMYDALLADLGNMAVIVGMEMKAIELDSMKTSDYAKLFKKNNAEVQTDLAEDSMVLFIKEKNEDSMLEEVEAYENIGEELPNIGTLRVEPSFVPINEKVSEKRATTIRKDKSGMTVAPKAAKTIRNLNKIEWNVDLRLAKKILKEDNRKSLLRELGYKTEKETTKLSFAKQEVQEALNRGAEKSVEELEMFVEKFKDGEKQVSVYFDWHYIKNGRYNLNSNTINPQTDLLHRFIVQPKNHAGEYTFDGSVFRDKGGQDVTYDLKYALAQAFGQKVDKKQTALVEEWGDAIIANAGNVDDMVEQYKKTGKVTVGEFEMGPDHYSHAMQAFDFLGQLNKVNDPSRGKVVVKGSLASEFDAATSGFANKMAQMGWLIPEWKEYMLKVGMIPKKWVDAAVAGKGVVGLSDKSMGALKKTAEGTMSMNDLYGNGLSDSYQSLGIDMPIPQDIGFKVVSERVAGKVKRDKTLMSLNTKPYGKFWEGFREAIPQRTGDEISSALRNLFKYPFMIFNYSAAIATLRRNLVGGMIEQIIDGVLDGSANKSAVDAMVKLTKAGSVEGLQEMLRDNNLSDIAVKGGNLEKAMTSLLQGSYGAEFEQVMTRKFGRFLEVQNLVNDSFKGMFRVYNVAYTDAMEKAREANDGGAITFEQKAGIINGLRSRFPAIKGPLSEENYNLIGIYSESTATPSGSALGTYGVQTHINKGSKVGKKDQETLAVYHKIKQFEEAVSAGSVVPYHYVDAAHVGEMFNEMFEKHGVENAIIHDAEIPPVGMGDLSQESYNEKYYRHNRDYNMVGEVVSSLSKITEDTDWDDEKYANEIVEVYNAETKKVEKVPLKEFIDSTLGGISAINSEIKVEKKKFYDDMEENGGYAMNMAGTEGGVHIVNKKAIKDSTVAKEGKPKKKPAIMENNKEAVKVLEKAGFSQEEIVDKLNKMNENVKECTNGM